MKWSNFTSCFLTSTRSDVTFTCSELLQSASLYLSSIHSGFSCHSKWWHSIHTVHFTFGYMRCSLNALPCLKCFHYSYKLWTKFSTSDKHQPGYLQTTEVFANTVYRACQVVRQEYSLYPSQAHPHSIL